MDRRWIYEADRREREFFNGVTSFVKAAMAYKSKQMTDYIYCPCVDCKNEKQFSNIEAIRAHLIRRGFKAGYTCWTEHGEHETVHEGQETEEGEDDIIHEDQQIGEDEENNDTTTVEDTFVHTEEADIDIDMMLRDAEGDLLSERDFERFQRVVEDSTTPLYPGCKEEHKKLHTVLMLLQLKARNGWSDKSFTELLGFLGKLLPEDNVLPETTYKAKQVVCPLGLEVRKIHACPNDCILYRNEFEDLDACVVCKASRYKRGDDIGSNRKKKRPPAKVVWYFPIIPRLKRLFANTRHAELLRWHVEKRKKDGMLRHPADSAQ